MPVNNTLKSVDHSDYDDTYSWWDRSTGVARLNQGFTLDAPLSTPTAEPGYTLYAVFNAALDNANVYPSTDTRIAAGIYAKQSGLPSGNWDYLYGAFTISAEVTGTVNYPTSHSYLLHTRTSRGFSLLSSLTTVASGPGTSGMDSDWADGARVFLSWSRPLQFGVIAYDVYRMTTISDFDAANTDDVTNETIKTSVAHGFANGDSVVFVEDNTLPAGLSENTAYFVRVIDSTTLALYDTYAHAIASPSTTGRINLTSAGTSTNTIRRFVKLRIIETGLTAMQDNNSNFADEYPTYPTADYTGLRAYTAMLPGVLSSMSVNGLQQWDTLPFAIKVPANFDMSTMNDTQAYQQWLRISLFGADGATDRLDWRATGVQPTGTLNPQEYIIPNGGVTANLTGLTANVYSKYGTITASVSGVTLTDPQAITLGFGGEWNGPDNYTGDCRIVVTGGAPSGAIHVDLCHMSYGPNAIFGFHTDDLAQERGIPPVAPNGSDQGGTGSPTGGGDGGTVGGGDHCVSVTEQVVVTDGAGAIFTLPAGDLDGEHYLFNHAKRITQLANRTFHKAQVWRVETENGFRADVSEKHKFLTFEGDVHGTPLDALGIGDTILTSVDGASVVSIIKDKYVIGQGVVAQFDLPTDRRFLCGSWDEGVCRKWGGIASHNKQDNPGDIPVT